MSKPRPLTWCQRQIMAALPDDGKWHNLRPSATAKDAAYFGACNRASVIQGLVKRGLIEHRPKDSRNVFEWVTEGQIRKVSKSEESIDLLEHQ